MGAINKITANQLMHIAGVSAKQYKKVPWHTTTITVRQLLPAKECYGLIGDILNDCKSPNGEFIIELLDFSIRTHIISAYAFVSLPENPDDLYYLVYASDLYDVVCSTINQSQFEMIKYSIELYVGRRCC